MPVLSTATRVRNTCDHSQNPMWSCKHGRSLSRIQRPQKHETGTSQSLHAKTWSTLKQSRQAWHEKSRSGFERSLLLVEDAASPTFHPSRSSTSDLASDSSLHIPCCGCHRRFHEGIAILGILRGRLVSCTVSVRRDWHAHVGHRHRIAPDAAVCLLIPIP